MADRAVATLSPEAAKSTASQECTARREAGALFAAAPPEAADSPDAIRYEAGRSNRRRALPCRGRPAKVVGNPKITLVIGLRGRTEAVNHQSQMAPGRAASDDVSAAVWPCAKPEATSR